MVHMGLKTVWTPTTKMVASIKVHEGKGGCIVTPCLVAGAEGAAAKEAVVLDRSPWRSSVSLYQLKKVMIISLLTDVFGRHVFREGCRIQHSCTGFQEHGTEQWLDILGEKG